MALDKAAASALLKELYDDEKIQNTLYPDNAMFAWMPKKSTQFVGSQHPIPIVYGNPQNVSADPSVSFGTSTSPTSTKSKRFIITRAFKYNAARITREMLKAGDGDKGSFIELASMEMDGALNAMVRRISVELYRDGNGVLGVIPASASVTNASGVLSIGNYNGGSVGSDIDNFESGMQLTFSGTANGAVRTGTAYVVAVDRSSNTVTLSATDGGAGSSPAGLVTGLTAGDFIFAKGDAQNGTGTAACVLGVDAWLPIVAPTTGDSFNNVDRSADPQRLAGVRIDGASGVYAGAPLQELLVAGAAQCGKYGGRPRAAFINWENWRSLELDLGSKCDYQMVPSSDNADIGFRSIRIHGGRVPIDVMPDQNCPASRAYLLDQDTWGLYRLGDKMPEIVEDDGMIMLRSPGADAYDVRFAGYLQLGCNAPGKNAVIKLS